MSAPQGQRFDASTRRISAICLAGGVILFALSLGTMIALRDNAVSAILFWMGLAALVGIFISAILIYRAIALFSLRYTLTRNGLDIRWGLFSHRIPIDQIKTMVPVTTDALPARRLLGAFTVPRWWLGRWRNAYFYAPTDTEKLVRVESDEAEIFASPIDADAFIAAWQARVPLGTTQHWHHEIIRHGFLRHQLWIDPLARRLVLGAIALTLVLVGGVFARYPSLPAQIPLQMTALGQSAALVARGQLLWLPVGGVVLLVFNLLLGAAYYGKNRFAAYVLWFLAALVQIGLWVGVRLVLG